MDTASAGGASAPAQPNDQGMGIAHDDNTSDRQTQESELAKSGGRQEAGGAKGKSENVAAVRARVGAAHIVCSCLFFTMLFLCCIFAGYA